MNVETVIEVNAHYIHHTNDTREKTTREKLLQILEFAMKEEKFYCRLFKEMVKELEIQKEKMNKMPVHPSPIKATSILDEITKKRENEEFRVEGGALHAIFELESKALEKEEKYNKIIRQVKIALEGMGIHYENPNRH